jgi:imidazolonepropionase-like amidohydrolase
MQQLISAQRLADGLSTSSREGQAVLVENGRIRAVGDLAQLKKDAAPAVEHIDLGTATLTPGLIDSHTHLSLAGDGRSYAEMFSDSDELMVLTGAMNMRQHLDAGITTIREHGARNKVGFVLKEGLAKGYIPGPRMQVSGRPITCTGGHFHMCNEVADGPDELRRSVRRLVHEGADYIKIMASGGGTAGTIPGRASYSVEELHAAVHEAHHLHRLTAAHCRAKESMQRAVEAGIDLIEHAEFLDPDDELRFDEDLAEKMAECGVWISPTLQAWTQYPRIAALETKREAGQLGPQEENELQALHLRAEKRLDIMRRTLDYCGRERIVPGTDSGVGNLAFGHLDYDLRLLVQIGFTPGEALLSATRISAAAIGLEKELGTIEVGKIADLVAFKNDPTSDVLAFSEVVAVFQAGVRVQ